MPWWGWIIVGALLMGAELFVIDAQFYLVFLGVSAIAVGVIALVWFRLGCRNGACGWRSRACPSSPC
jgi:membrane protein implicated in regulation of membrane protease activity